MLVWVLLACTGSAPAFDCSKDAMRDTDGQVDPCDEQACQACANACSGTCVVEESFPPRYSCPGGSSWSGYDFCNGWNPIQ